MSVKIVGGVARFLYRVYYYTCRVCKSFACGVSTVCGFLLQWYRRLLLCATTFLISVFIGLHVWIYFRYVRLDPGKSVHEFAPNISGVIRSENGLPLAKFGNPEYRVIVPYAAIPAHIVQAFLAAEDSRFFWPMHWGIDYPRVIMAIVTNTRRGHIVSGASSIDMQRVKNYLIIDRWSRQWNKKNTVTREENVLRKIDEASLAFRMNIHEFRKSKGSWWDVTGNHHSAKERIFEQYVALIYFGHLPGGGAPQYGITAAADMYFDKTLEGLSIDEAALLAGIVKDANKFNSFIHPGLAKSRRDFVLGRMLEEGYITHAQHDMSVQKPFVVRELKSNPWNPRDFAPAGIRYAYRQLSKDQIQGLNKRGYEILTTVDDRLQEIANREMLSMFRAYEARHQDQPTLLGKIGGSIIILKNNGDIKAIAEGDNAQRLTRWDGVHPTWWGIGRQPGSAFKLFVQLALLEKANYDIGPNEEGRPYQLFGGHVAVRMGNGRLHVIRNYKGDRTGYESAAQAFAESHNIPHMWAVLNPIDTNDAIEMARRLGVNGYFGFVVKDGGIRYFPTNAIGAGEVLPLELALAYAQIANGGCKIDKPRIISQIRRPGKEPELYPPNTVVSPCNKLVSDYVEERMLALLRSPVLWRHGTAYWVLGEGAKIIKTGDPIPFPILIKTGTTNDFTNAWSIISTYGPEGYTVLAWMGLRGGGSIGDDTHGGWKDLHAEPGGRGPGRAAGNIITEIYRDIPRESIPRVPEASEALIRKAMESFK